MNPGDVAVTPSLDTGDIIVHRPTKEVHMVACVHYPWLHTIGFPELRLQVDSCVLKTKASDMERKRQLEAMAQSSSKSHRANCARDRLAVLISDEAYADPYYGD